MFKYTVALQGRTRENVVLRAITDGAAAATFLRLRAAYAYVSSGGAYELIHALEDAMPNWDAVSKQWLVAFDFGHTDPRGLDLLLAASRSEIRIPYATEVLASGRLNPKTTFHPKTMILDGAGQAHPPAMIAIGSANMTVSGLRTGHEDIAVALWTGGRLTRDAREQLAAMRAEAVWFDRVWARATRLTPALLARYRTARSTATNHEDASQRVREIQATRIMSFEQAAVLRSSGRLWVEVNNVAENLGPGRPGNQLHFRRGTRIFFGLTSRIVPKMTALGTVMIEFGGHAVPRNMRYGHNGMDTLDMPFPGIDGPSTYEHSVIMFERSSSSEFQLSVGSRAQIRGWKRQSTAEGTLYRLSGGREWGVLP